MATRRRFRVTGNCRVAGVAPGDVVELDPEHVNVDALLAAGHLEPVTTKPATPTASDDPVAAEASR